LIKCTCRRRRWGNRHKIASKLKIRYSQEQQNNIHKVECDRNKINENERSEKNIIQSRYHLKTTTIIETWQPVQPSSGKVGLVVHGPVTEGDMKHSANQKNKQTEAHIIRFIIMISVIKVNRNKLSELEDHICLTNLALLITPHQTVVVRNKVSA
jgi:hypothetical protein